MVRAHFDLILTLKETDQGIQGNLVYATALFERPTITRLVGHFQRLLEGIHSDPDRAVQSYDFLDAGERHQLLFAWND